MNQQVEFEKNIEIILKPLLQQIINNSLKSQPENLHAFIISQIQGDYEKFKLDHPHLINNQQKQHQHEIKIQETNQESQQQTLSLEKQDNNAQQQDIVEKQKLYEIQNQQPEKLQEHKEVQIQEEQKEQIKDIQQEPIQEIQQQHIQQENNENKDNKDEIQDNKEEIQENKEEIQENKEEIQENKEKIVDQQSQEEIKQKKQQRLFEWTIDFQKIEPNYDQQTVELQNQINEVLRQKFENKNEEEIKHLSKQSHYQQIDAGECIYRENQEIKNIYIVLEGEMDNYKHFQSKDEEQLKGICKNDVFGQDNQSSVISQVDSSLLSFPKLIYEQA